MDVARPDAPKPGAPVVLVLHGLNGGSAEAYVQDLVTHVTAKGGVACVLVARGLMATPVRDDLFHGARPGGTRRGAFENASRSGRVPEFEVGSRAGGRTSDVAAAVDALRESYGDRIVLVGISMGGIVALNYTARAGKGCGLQACVALSGTTCSEAVLGPAGRRSRRLWQPMLAWCRPRRPRLVFSRWRRRRGADRPLIESRRRRGRSATVSSAGTSSRASSRRGAFY